MYGQLGLCSLGLKREVEVGADYFWSLQQPLGLGIY